MNQNHSTLPKKKRMDVQGNDKRRVFVKSGNATMMLAKGLSKNACDILETKILDTIDALGGECTCFFLKWR